MRPFDRLTSGCMLDDGGDRSVTLFDADRSCPDLPSVISTPFAGQVALRRGARITCAGGLALAALGLLLLLPSLSAVLLGLVLLSLGTFFA
jgi:hypothetical protein